MVQTGLGFGTDWGLYVCYAIDMFVQGQIEIILERFLVFDKHKFNIRPIYANFLDRKK